MERHTPVILVPIRRCRGEGRWRNAQSVCQLPEGVCEHALLATFDVGDRGAGYPRNDALGQILLGVAEVLDWVLVMYMWVIIARALISFFMPEAWDAWEKMELQVVESIHSAERAATICVSIPKRRAMPPKNSTTPAKAAKPEDRPTLFSHSPMPFL